MQKRFSLRSAYQDIMKALLKESTLYFIRSKQRENIDLLLRKSMSKSQNIYYIIGMSLWTKRLIATIHVMQTL